MSEHDWVSEADALDDMGDDDFLFLSGNAEEGGEFVIFPFKAKEEAAQALFGRNRTSVVQDTRTQEEVIADMRARYVKAKAAKVGEVIECACCAKKVVKTSYQMAFCSNGKNRKNQLLGNNNCKDRYWNLTDDKRRAVAVQVVENRNAKA